MNRYNPEKFIKISIVNRCLLNPEDPEILMLQVFKKIVCKNIWKSVKDLQKSCFFLIELSFSHLQHTYRRAIHIFHRVFQLRLP